MKLGITGTRSGMSPEQKVKFLELIEELKPDVFIDGCCVGVDEECFLLVKDLLLVTVGRPGYSALTQEEINNNRSVYQRDKMYPSKTHFARNRDIVNESDVMIAIPYELGGKGGTNYTIDYAIKVGKPLYIILRDGATKTHNI